MRTRIPCGVGPGITWCALSRAFPEGFDLKQTRIVRRASGYYVMLSLQCDVSVPDVMPHGLPKGIDVGLNSFVATSEGELITRPKFFVDAQSKLKSLQRRLKHKKKRSKNWRKLNRKIASALRAVFSKRRLEAQAVARIHFKL